MTLCKWNKKEKIVLFFIIAICICLFIVLGVLVFFNWIKFYILFTLQFVLYVSLTSLLVSNFKKESLKKNSFFVSLFKTLFKNNINVLF